MLKFAVSLIVLLAVNSAFADQCSVLTKKEAQQAMQLLSVGSYIGEACEPCGDLGIGKTAEIKSVSFHYSQMHNGYVVKVNSDFMDLAYTYLNVNLDTYVNVAKIIGCKSEDVSGVLKKDLLAQ